MENYLHAVHAYEQNFSAYSPVIFERNIPRLREIVSTLCLSFTFKIVILSIQ